MSSVAAVVVTHNRIELLIHCINALRNQSVKIDSIIVIDNGSTDDTNVWLDKQKDLKIFHQDNSGSSGGFYRGIKEAYDAGHDLIWVMDDDAIPRVDCLEQMLSAAKESSVLYPAYFPTIIEDGKPAKKYHGNIRFMPNMKMIQTKLAADDNNFNDHKIIPAEFGSYLGLLLRRSTVEKVGFPNPDFFIHADDVEYCIRISELCGKMAYVKDAMIDHRLVKTTGNVHTRSVMGYTFQNTDIGRLPMHYFGLRNVIYLKAQHFRKHSHLKMLQFRLFLMAWYTRNSFRILLGEDNKIIRLKFFWSCINDGLTGKFNNKKPFEIVFGKK
jgi:rhamnopyranosyl-N-acetylglucosaminyl-diphospho-decaprenol beta-1,3/1,4-galactofuranosyltransferase